MASSLINTRVNVGVIHVREGASRPDLSVTNTCNFGDHLIMRVLWRTGVRVSELLNITPQDIEFHNQVINITKAKGGKQWRVLLDDETLKLLSEYISTQNIPRGSTYF